MLLKYEKSFCKREKIIKPNERYSDYDVDKMLHKINNYKRPVTPDFKRMISRPDTAGQLPMYMKKIFDRQSVNICNENSLKMNNFMEGKFSKSQTMFMPKKSFNKMINLNLLSSKKFKQNLGILNKDDEEKKDEIPKSVKNSMKFYNKNYDEILKEVNIKKFDGITYKTFKRKSKINTTQIEKYLLNFE